MLFNWALDRHFYLCVCGFSNKIESRCVQGSLDSEKLNLEAKQRALEKKRSL